ncbi:MAG TPA: S9 family peptidase [Terracidiphilus sp.]|nr:S9 family peptidase [Terracidiphilus sp.]
MPLLPRSLRCTVLALTLCATSLLPVCAQTSTPASASPSPNPTPSSQRRVITIGQISVSPDGKRLAWLDSGAILVTSLDNLSHSQRVTAGLPSDNSCTESDLAWSPDSAALAFLSDCADLGGQSDLYLSHLDGKPPQRLSNLHGDVNAPAFSPDGKRIAFLYVEGATRPAGALAAMGAPSGVIGEDNIEVQRVAVVAASVPIAAPQPVAPVFLTPANLNVYEFDWSPDSTTLAYVAADPPGENNWWVARLYTQTVGAPGPDSGTRDSANSKPTAILSPAAVSGPLHGLQIAFPRWSPDGKSIAFIGGLMSDQGVTGGDVWKIDAAGGQPLNLTPNRPASSQWIAWGDDEHIFSLELADGVNRLVRFRLQPGRTSESAATSVAAPVFAYPGTVGTGNFDHDLYVNADRSLFVFQASSFNQPPEIYAAGPSAAALATQIAGAPGPSHLATVDASQTVGAPGPSRSGTGDASDASGAPSGLTQLSHFNDGLKPTWGDSASLTWTNDNFHIQGWLLLPAHYDPSKKYPLIVEVHGGPAADVASRWNGGGGGFSATGYSALGYFVLMPNPRGSYGQGEAFTQANRKDFGYGDLRDILAGVDTVLAKYPVDPNRVGITGWSYGGFMTMFAVTQTHRFKAAVAGAGISDWLSYYGENSIDQWMIPYLGASVYDDPQVYAKSSAISFIKNVTTPTLTVVGDRDGECPAPQSFEFWHALRDLHVPAQLVVYPNEGHGFSDPAHRQDVQQRAVEWFAKYMPPTP